MTENHPPLLVLGYSQAAMLLRKPDRSGVEAIIAIHGQREYPVDTDGVRHSLILDFEDTEAPSRTDPIHAARIRMRARKAAEIGLRLTPPAPDHAKSVIEFAQSIRTMKGALLCHCHGGISRSPAMALLCLATWTGPDREKYCVEHLLAICPAAVPHLDLVTFGDEFLQRKGKLVQAIQDARPY